MTGWNWEAIGHAAGLAELVARQRSLDEVSKLADEIEGLQFDLKDWASLRAAYVAGMRMAIGRVACGMLAGRACS